MLDASQPLQVPLHEVLWVAVIFHGNNNFILHVDLCHDISRNTPQSQSGFDLRFRLKGNRVSTLCFDRNFVRKLLHTCRMIALALKWPQRHACSSVPSFAYMAGLHNVDVDGIKDYFADAVCPTSAVCQI